MEPTPAGRLIPLTPGLISSVVRNFASQAPAAASPPPPLSPPPFLFSDRPPIPEEEFSLELLGAAAASAPIPDLTKELRNTNFPIVHLLLRTSLQEFVSTKAPQYSDLSDISEGWMYLYDGKVENYKDDAIRWRSNKMNVKLVVRNRGDGTYKLKNKKEEGDTVMRRQTWHEEGVPVGREYEWRKHEYKLVKKVNYYRQMPDGQITLTQAPSLQNYPVLVHYFKKSNVAPAKEVAKRGKRARHAPEPEDAEADTEGSTSVVEEMPGPSVSGDATTLLADAEMKYFSGNPLFPSHVPGATDETFPRAIGSLTTKVDILSYAPDSALAGESVKVLVVLRLPATAMPPLSFGAYIEGPTSTLEVVATSVIPGVVEFCMPEQPIAGVARFWVTYRGANSTTQYSSALQFAYLPSDDDANKAIESDNEIRQLLPRFRLTTHDLDVSHCELTRLDFIAGFTQLTTLILDHNKLSAATRLPFLPLLHTLFMNSNLIASSGLGTFVDHLAVTTPRLRYLSLIHNEACPLGTASHHYYNYRIYVLSKLPLLTKLDSSNITDEERKGAAAIREDR